jgi:hypothetical protein
LLFLVILIYLAKGGASISSTFPCTALKQDIMNTIELRLDMNEVNVIIRALSDRPFREVYELLGKIHAQSQAQLTQPAASKNSP